MRTNTLLNIVLSPPYDPNVTSFLLATGIEDPKEINAIRYLVRDLKINSLWSRFHALYPLVGGTASTHSFNLINPNQYRITWSGTVTHDANGITGNGTTGYGNTGYVVPVELQDNFHLSIYARTNVNENSCDIGAAVPASLRFTQIFTRIGGLLDVGLNTNNTESVASSDSRGYTNATRTAASVSPTYRNGALAINGTLTSTTPTVQPIYILARNSNGTAGTFSTRNLALASIGLSFTAAQEAVLYTIIQNYQTRLSRQV